MKNIWCLLGIHKWGKERQHSIFGSNVVDYTKYCNRCSKNRRRVIARERSLDD